MEESVCLDMKNLDLVELAQQPEWKTMIVNVVHKERMDPWNIDISVLAAKFLERVNEMKRIDFRIPANAILASSILLRFKSDAWSVAQEADVLYEPIYIPDEIISEPIFPTLEPSIRVTKRKVTLDELIDAIDDIIVREKKNVEKKRVMNNVIPPQLVDLMKQDGVDFEKKVEEIYEKMLKTADSSNLTLFSNLLSKKDADDVIEHLVPMLHLANKLRIDVWQDEVFGEIFINVVKPQCDAK